MGRPPRSVRLPCLLALALLQPAGPAEPVTRVLFVGNSFTFGHDLPRLVAEQAMAHEPPVRIEVRVVARDGMTLERHWEQGEAARLLERQRWDVVVLQEQSSRPLIEPERMASAVRRFAALARERGTAVVLFETWAPTDRPESQGRLAAVYRRVAQDVKAAVAPVGTAWSRALAAGTEDALHADDGIHAGPAGARLAASVILETLLALTGARDTSSAPG